MTRGPSKPNRGQAHTLEAVVGALILLLAVAFALQMTVVTPLSASTSSQHIEGQQRAVAQGVLATAAEEGALKEAVLYRNITANSFHNTDTEQGFYAETRPDIRFSQMLSRAFDEEGIAYNVVIYHQPPIETERTEINQEAMIFQGTPSDNAVAASRTLVLRNDDRLVDEGGSLNETTVSEADAFYIRNGHAAPSGVSDGHGLYNVVRVEVIAWRI